MASPAEHKEIRVRMAPSPTGPLHIGTARMTLFDFLFARHHGGTFILRIEDTDPERSKTEHEIGLVEGLHWLGIDWDEGPTLKDGILASKGDYGPYRDSERVESHKKYIQKFLEEGKAYQCYCTKEELEAQRKESEGRGVPFRYPGTCRNVVDAPIGKTPQVVRLRMPDEAIVFNDMIRGRVAVEASELDDFAIARADGSPLYNFAVAIDDYEMKISHVIRGEDHISNTPKQIAVYRALGAEPPIFAHTPLILNLDRSKMSKRSGDTALVEYRNKGYLPEAIVNFLALMGWHPKDDREVLGLEELIELFDISRVQKAGAVFDQNKLDWLNREYLKKISNEEIAKALVPFWESGVRSQESGATQEIGLPISDHAMLLKIIALGRGRASTLCDFIDEGKSVLVLPDYEPSLLVWKNAAKENVTPILEELSEKINAIAPEKFIRENLAAAVAAVVENKSNSGNELPSLDPRSRGEVFWPLRVAVTGRERSPDPIEVMDILGKEESLRRITIAIQKCNLI